MNKQLQDFARKTLKEGLAALTNDNLDVFRRMYSPKELMKSLDKVIDDIPEEKLDWAMTQVKNTLDKVRKS